MRGLQAHDLDFFADFDDPALYPARHYRATAGYGENVFHRHQEGAVHRPHRLRYVAVQRIRKLEYGGLAYVALGRLPALSAQSL